LPPLHARQRLPAHDRLRAGHRAEAGRVAHAARDGDRPAHPGLARRRRADRSHGHDVQPRLHRSVDESRLGDGVRRSHGDRDGLAVSSAGAWEVGRVFLKLGAMSYGGPAMMGIMQAEIERKRQWVTRERFVEGLALVNLLPGPLAVQLSIVLGYARAGWLGGVLGGLGFIVPGFAIMLALTLLYSAYGALPTLRGVFYGMSPVVIGIFAVAVYRLGRAAVKGRAQIRLPAGVGPPRPLSPP